MRSGSGWRQDGQLSLILLGLQRYREHDMVAATPATQRDMNRQLRATNSVESVRDSSRSKWGGGLRNSLRTAQSSPVLFEPLTRNSVRPACYVVAFGLFGPSLRMPRMISSYACRSLLPIP